MKQKIQLYGFFILVWQAIFYAFSAFILWEIDFRKWIWFDDTAMRIVFMLVQAVLFIPALGIYAWATEK